MKNLRDIDVHGKVVLARVDFNVPIVEGVITDVNRIKQAIPTLEYLLDNGAKVVLLSHLGKVKTIDDKKSKSLRIVAEKLAEISDFSVKFVDETRGEKVENMIAEADFGEIVMLENTRFEDLCDSAESKNDPQLGKY
jgi:phosphoglycerate kinase